MERVTDVVIEANRMNDVLIIVRTTDVGLVEKEAGLLLVP
jgi:hypothetical protein